MRTWLVYGSVVLVSVAAGVMLGGGPSALLDSADSSPLVSSADDLPPPAPEIPEFGEPSVTSPSTDAADTTSTTSPATTSTTSTSSTTTPPTTTTSTTSTTSSTTSSTTTEPPSPSTTSVDEIVDAELVPRSELPIAVYNGIGSVGLAGRAADALIGLGYVDPATRDATPTVRTLVYFRPGLDGEARRLAVDSGLPADATESIDLLTGTLGSGTGDFSLVLVLGGDRVGLAGA